MQEFFLVETGGNCVRNPRTFGYLPVRLAIYMGPRAVPVALSSVISAKHWRKYYCCTKVSYHTLTLHVFLFRQLACTPRTRTSPCAKVPPGTPPGAPGAGFVCYNSQIASRMF